MVSIDARARFAIRLSLLISEAMRMLGRQGSTLPGRIGLLVDHDLLDKASIAIREGSVIVVGTNGKTTTNNMVYRALQAAGFTVACNAEGANMATGVMTTLARTLGFSVHGQADWASIEVDEFSAPRVASALHPHYLLLLNLFRDQLDRYGEIDVVIEKLIATVESQPQMTVIYNADDPLCSHIASKALKRIGFGIDQDLNLPKDLVVEGRFCMECGALLSYHYRQYGQLGDWFCEACGNARAPRDFSATDIDFGETYDSPMRFMATRYVPTNGSTPLLQERLTIPSKGAYMVYNILGAYSVSTLIGASPSSFKRMLGNFRTSKGRQERFTVDSVPVMVNLAKNPTGFNQNISVVLNDVRPKAVIFIVNDNSNDGHDISWLWDVDYERLAASGSARFYAGGHRMNDLQVRLKYAGIPVRLSSDTATSVKEAIAKGAQVVYVLPNYSALSPARTAVEGISSSPSASRQDGHSDDILQDEEH